MDITIAALEIKNTTFKLMVGYLYENKVDVLFNQSYPLRSSNKDGDIYDLQALTEDLKQIRVIRDEKKALELKINEVVLILPPFGLEVYNSEKSTNTISSDGKISKTDIANVLSLVKRDRLESPNDKIADIVPNTFLIEGNRVYHEPPLDETSEFVSIKAEVYTLPSKIIDNFKNAVIDAGITVKRVIIAPLGVASLFKSAMLDLSSYVLVDYNADNTTLSFVGNGTLYHSKYFSIGGNEITKNIANSFEISMKAAEELKCIYGYDERNSDFNAPIIQVSGEDGVNRKFNKNELNSIVDYSLKTWNSYFINCFNMLLAGYDDLKHDIPLVFVGGASKLNGFKKFIETNYPSNRVIFYTYDSLGASSPSDINLLGAIAFASSYKGSLEDTNRVVISSIKREENVYKEDEDEL